MDTFLEPLFSGIVRTTICTTAGALTALLLLPTLGVNSPRIHRVAWVLVLLQGWILIPFTFTVSIPHTPTPAFNSHLKVSQQQVANTTSMEHAPVLSTFEKYWKPTLIAFWMLGTITVIGHYLRQYSMLVANVPLGESPERQDWQEEWNQATSRLKSPSKVQLRITRDIGPLLCYVPYVYLILVPRLLWASLSSSDRVAILQHEISHLKRADLWTNLAIRLFAVPQWFNPFVWIAIRRFEEAGEWACDEAVLASRPATRNDYANTLIRVAEYSALAPCGTVAASGGNLTRRISRLTSSPDKEVSKMKTLAVPLVLIAITAGQAIRIEAIHAKETPAARARAEAVAKWKATGYIIEPPDILLIEAEKLIPKGPYAIAAFDTLSIRVKSEFPDQSIDDSYSVDADGQVNLGPPYGRVKVTGLTVEEAENEIQAHLAKIVTNVWVSVSLLQSSGAQQITGQHLVGPDGRVNLGEYGSAYVAGMSIEESREAIEKQLSLKLEDPKVFVDVLAYNSKVYYVVKKGGGSGDNVLRLTITGNETVLDAIANLGGSAPLASAKLWIAQPAPNGVGCEQIIPIEWDKITQGNMETNYQLIPGDRLFVDFDPHDGVEEQSTKQEPSISAPPEPVVHLNQYQPESADSSPASVGSVVSLVFEGETARQLMAPIIEGPAPGLDVQIAAKVTAIDSDGNLVVKTTNQVELDGRKLLRTISGNVRPVDVKQGNQIKSKNIADLRIDLRETPKR